MSTDREAEFRRLLRWFPHTWRAKWEDVALGSLLDDAEQRQLARLSRVEAWSLRAHGLVERVAAAVRPLTITALTVAALGATTYLLLLQVPWLVWLGSVCAAFVAPLLIAAVAAGLGYRGGLLTVRGTVGSLLIGAVALAFGYLAGRSWSVGFDEANAGRAQSSFAAAFVPLALSGVAAGAAALLPLALGILTSVRARSARVPLAVLIASTSSVAIGAALVMPTSAALAAAALVVVTFRRTAAPATGLAERGAPAAAPGLRWGRRRRTALTGITAAAGTVSVLFALTGSAWPGYHGDGTQAMNLGLAAASLSAIPLAVVLGNLLHTKPRYRSSLASATMLGALLSMATAQGMGAGSTLQITFLLCAGALAGLTAALLALPLFPYQRAARIALVVGITVATFTTVGLPAAVVAPFAAPVCAIVMLLIGARRNGAKDLAPGAVSA